MAAVHAQFAPPAAGHLIAATRRNRMAHGSQRLLFDALFGVITSAVVLVTIVLAFTLTKPIQPLNVFFVVAIVMISLPQLVLVRRHVRVYAALSGAGKVVPAGRPAPQVPLPDWLHDGQHHLPVRLRARVLSQHQQGLALSAVSLLGLICMSHSEAIMRGTTRACRTGCGSAPTATAPGSPAPVRVSGPSQCAHMPWSRTPRARCCSARRSSCAAGTRPDAQPPAWWPAPVTPHCPHWPSPP